MSIREAALARAQAYADWDAKPGNQFEVGQNQGERVDHALAFVGLGNPPDPESGYPYCAAGACLCIGEALGFPQRDKSDVHRQMRQMGILPSAGVFAMRNYAKEHGTWRAAGPGVMPEVGWLVVFSFSHIGFVKERKTDAKGKLVKLVTVEFNTQSGQKGDQRDGGGVYVRTRELTHVAGYIAVP